MLRNAVRGGGCQLSRKKSVTTIMTSPFNVISVTRGGWGPNFQEKSVRNILIAPWP